MWMNCVGRKYMNTGYKISVENKKRKILEDAISWLKENSFTNAEGKWSIRVSRFEMMVEETLVSNIVIKPRIPRTVQITVIKNAIRRWWRYKKYIEHVDPVKGFTDAILFELEKYEKGKQKFTVLKFLNIDITDLQGRTKFKLRDLEIEFVEWNELKNIDLQTLWTTMDFHKGQLPNRKNPIVFENDGRFIQRFTFYPCIIEIKTWDKRSAVDEVTIAFDLFRSFLNIMPSRDNLWTSANSAHSRFLPSPITGVFNDSGDLVEPYFNSTNYRYSKMKINEVGIKNLDWFYKNVGMLDKEKHKFVHDLMLLYQEAIDRLLDRTMFLGLWQVLENSAQVERGQRHEEVTKRIKNLLGIKDVVVSGMLDSLRPYRNDLVHIGEFPIYNNNLLMSAKSFASDTIVTIIKLLPHVNSLAELREIIKLMGQPENKLKRTRELIDYLINLNK